MIDHLTNNRIQTQTIAGLDHLTDFVRTYLIACKVEGKSPRTIENYNMVLSRYINFDGDSGPSANQVRQFLLFLQVEEGLSPSTIHIYYRGLKTFFNWLVAEDFLAKSPMANIRAPRIPKLIIKPFSRQDIDNLLLLCSASTFLDQRNRAIILVFLDTGIRLAEMAGIQLPDVSFDHETIRIMGKGAKERVVRIGKTAQKALLKYLLSRDDRHPCLWVTEERKPLTRDGIKIMVKRLCFRAEITDAKPGAHTFRHTFAINFLRNGGDVFSLQIILGHATLAMTRRYVSALGFDDAFIAHQKASPVDRMFRK